MYGIVFDYEIEEGRLCFIPDGCQRVLWYSTDGKTFQDKPCPVNTFTDKEFFIPEIWNRLSLMGKYKLDIAVRTLFPKYKDSQFVK